jgi:hypothetical protein
MEPKFLQAHIALTSCFVSLHRWSFTRVCLWFVLLGSTTMQSGSQSSSLLTLSSSIFFQLFRLFPLASDRIFIFNASPQLFATDAITSPTSSFACNQAIVSQGPRFIPPTKKNIEIGPTNIKFLLSQRKQHKAHAQIHLLNLVQFHLYPFVGETPLRQGYQWAINCLGSSVTLCGDYRVISLFHATTNLNMCGLFLWLQRSGISIQRHLSCV